MQSTMLKRVLTLDLIRKSWHLQLRVGGLQWSVASFYSESSSVNVDLSLFQCVLQKLKCVSIKSHATSVTLVTQHDATSVFWEMLLPHFSPMQMGVTTLFVNNPFIWLYLKQNESLVKVIQSNVSTSDRIGFFNCWKSKQKRGGRRRLCLL